MCSEFLNICIYLSGFGPFIRIRQRVSRRVTYLYCSDKGAVSTGSGQIADKKLANTSHQSRRTHNYLSLPPYFPRYPRTASSRPQISQACRSRLTDRTQPPFRCRPIPESSYIQNSDVSLQSSVSSSAIAARESSYLQARIFPRRARRGRIYPFLFLGRC